MLDRADPPWQLLCSRTTVPGQVKLTTFPCFLPDLAQHTDLKPNNSSTPRRLSRVICPESESAGEEFGSEMCTFSCPVTHFNKHVVNRLRMTDSSDSPSVRHLPNPLNTSLTSTHIVNFCRTRMQSSKMHIAHFNGHLYWRYSRGCEADTPDPEVTPPYREQNDSQTCKNITLRQKR